MKTLLCSICLTQFNVGDGIITAEEYVINRIGSLGDSYTLDISPIRITDCNGNKATGKDDMYCQDCYSKHIAPLSIISALHELDKRIRDEQFLVYEPGSETIRQMPENYMIAHRSIDANSPDWREYWIADPDVACNPVLAIDLFILLLNYEGRYATGEELMRRLNK